MPKWNDWIAIAAAAVFGLIGGATAVAISAIQPTIWEALGALSGWMAAVGALAAAVLTLRPLLGQLREARRHTDFIVGDAPPTLDVVQSKDPFEVSFADLRIVNWNRRPLILRKIEVDLPTPGVCPIVETQINNRALTDKEFECDDFESYRKIVPVPGWEDRNERPNHAKIELAAVTVDQIHDTNQEYEIPVRVYCRLVGDTHQDIVLKASGRLPIRQ